MKKLIYTLLIIIIFSLVSCGGEEEDKSTPVVPETKSQIQMIPKKISITDLDTATFYLSIKNSTSTTWRATKYPTWLLLSQTNGRIDKEIIELKAVVDKSYTEERRMIGKIEITTDDAGECYSLLDAYIGLYPDPYLPKSEFYFDSSLKHTNFAIINKGNAPLNAIFVTSDNWINTAGQISVPPNSEKDCFISLNKNNSLPKGIHNGEVKMYYNNYTDSLIIKATAKIEEIKRIRANKNSLNFDFDELQKSMEITNIGNSNYQWKFASDNPAVSCYPNSGNLNINEKIKLQINVDRSECLSGYLNNFMYFINSRNDTFAIPLKINHYQEDKFLIEGEVIDATYNKAKEKLFLVTEHPNKLIILNINDYSMEDIPLKVSPNCLSVTKDGKYAVVGHDAYISYINLSTQQETNLISLPHDIEDILLAPNGWTYFIFKENNNKSMGYIDSKKENVKTFLASSNWESKIILNPSDNYIYTNRGTKYDIRKDSLILLYNYPHSQTQDWKGNGLLITEDKNTLVTSIGYVYKLSENRADDMTMISNINFSNYLIWLTYSSETNMFAGLVKTFSAASESSLSDKIEIFDASSYSMLRSISLPYFGYRDARQKYQLYRSASEYCFFNNSGSKIITIMRTTLNFPGKRIWGVYTIDI